ncbi:hypothetical protein [Paracoccus sp. SY]|uniref:hypothetical protein n=1 Tax=Paracoccus sp. SY TaxID=1330255 RepID=UPI000CCFF4C7|nr:hypothetical protein [Paracoccus sp. SY]
MIILALILILTGSFAGAFLLWLHDASFWMIVLGYVGGGWAGLLAGLPMILLVRLYLNRRRMPRRRWIALADAKAQHSKGQ